MYVGASRGSKGTRYLNYRCNTDDCPRVKKSIRGKVIFNHIYDFLKDGLHFTEDDYKYYATDLTEINESKRMGAYRSSYIAPRARSKLLPVTLTTSVYASSATRKVRRFGRLTTLASSS